MNYYKSAYYTYQPTTTHSTYYNSWLQKQDHQTHQRGYGSQRAGTSQDHRRHPPPSLTSGFSQSSFDSPSSYLSTPKELFGYEKASNKFSSGAGADAASASKQGNEQQTGESISGMLSNFSKALGKLFWIWYDFYMFHFNTKNIIK